MMLRVITCCELTCAHYFMIWLVSNTHFRAAQAAKQLSATRTSEREEVGSLVFNSFVFMQVRTPLTYLGISDLHCA